MRYKFAIMALLLPLHAHAQSFTCNYGSQPACLGYGETVCSSSGKCVSDSAKCFDSYQCNYEGFTCKSNLTDCAEEYESLLSTHNDLVFDYNELLEQSKRINVAIQDAADCMRRAHTLSDAQYCIRLIE